MTTPLTCKFCRSPNIVKHGTKAGVQRFLCKNCAHHFYDNTSEFPRMRVNSHAIVTALNLYFEGLSVRKVANQLKEIFGEEVSKSTIYFWIQKYTELVSEYASSLSPQLSETWHADELFVKIRNGIDYRKNQGIGFLWNVMDRRTRFLLASQLSPLRDRSGALAAFDTARRNAHGNYPNLIMTDSAGAYNGIKYDNATGWNPDHIAKAGIAKPHATNNRIERLNGTLRERVKIQRGWKSFDSGIPEGQRIHYNFCRAHSALDGKTPAEACGLEAVKGWKQLILNAQEQKTQEEVETKRVERLIQVSARSN